MTANADMLWKMIVQELFEDLVAFALPELYSTVRWDKEIKFLEQEISRIKMPRKKGTRYVDILASMHLNDGEESLILLHVEIQDDPVNVPTRLSERMYQYYIRICDKLEKDVTALALLIGDANDRGIYHKEKFGTKITYEYNVLHLKGLDAQKLETSSNPFALAALAGQRVIQAKGSDEKKLSFVRELFKMLKARGYEASQMTSLFMFLEGLFEPKDKKTRKEYTQEVEKMICNQELPVVMTPTVRRWCKEAKSKGRIEGKLEGKLEGKQEGKLEGKLEGRLETARNLLSMGLPVDQIARGTGLTEEEVRALQGD